MKRKTKIPSFYAPYKRFDGKMCQVDVVPYLLSGMLNSKGGISKKQFRIYEDNGEIINVTNRDQFGKFIRTNAMYYFWAKCEWEFIAIDWPYREAVNPQRDRENDNLISINHPYKIDVYEIIEPNLDLITDILWDALKEKIAKSVEK